MSAHTSELDAILKRIDAAQQSFVQALSLFSDEQMTTTHMEDGSTIKDMLAHVSFWDRRFMHAMQPEPPHAFRLVTPEIADIPYYEDMRWADAVNARVRRLNQDRAVAEIRREYEQNWILMAAFLDALTPHDVFDSDGLSALIGMPFEPFMRGIYEHYEEHAEELHKHRAQST
jgi:hypothetical protein